MFHYYLRIHLLCHVSTIIFENQSLNRVAQIYMAEADFIQTCMFELFFQKPLWLVCMLVF